MPSIGGELTAITLIYSRSRDLKAPSRLPGIQEDPASTARMVRCICSRTYLVVLAIEACPISLLKRQASIPPLACIVPVVCRRQCGCTGQVILAFCRRS